MYAGQYAGLHEIMHTKHGEEKLNRKVLERLNETGYEIVSDNVFKSVSDTQTPQGSSV